MINDLRWSNCRHWRLYSLPFPYSGYYHLDCYHLEHSIHVSEGNWCVANSCSFNDYGFMFTGTLLFVLDVSMRYRKEIRRHGSINWTAPMKIAFTFFYTYRYIVALLNRSREKKIVDRNMRVHRTRAWMYVREGSIDRGRKELHVCIRIHWLSWWYTRITQGWQVHGRPLRVAFSSASSRPAREAVFLREGPRVRYLCSISGPGEQQISHLT